MMALEMNQENPSKGLSRVWDWLREFMLQKIVNVVRNAAQESQRLGQEDPRRIVHSLKVGLAIAAVSLFYYFDFSYEGYGVSAMWAVMTVVVVFEFSVGNIISVVPPGATLGKGINRGIATLLGGALGIAVHRLASFSGEMIESIVLGMSVFFIGAVVTFIRFFPKMKARYDYGLQISILTFSLITVSGYRDDEIFQMARQRLFTVLIGGSIAVFVCVFLCPVWAGEDLHKHVASNIEKLALFLEGFEREYFQVPKSQENEASMNNYKSVLTSKGMEDSLVNCAKWEPRHGKFRYRHPWDQYLKIGSLTRECAYKMDALNAFLNSNPEAMTKLQMIRESCSRMSLECSYALREISIGIGAMTNCAVFVDCRIGNANSAVLKLESSFKTGVCPDLEMVDVFAIGTVASLLMGVVECTTKIANFAHELALMLKFKSPADGKGEKQNRLERMTSSIESHQPSTITVE